MTFNQYIDNPMGKANAVFSQRYLYKDLYTDKFNKLFLREVGKIDYRLLLDKKNDEYYCHIKIPSEVVPHFYYDVVIKFYTKNNAFRTESTLSKYDVQFYSNDPAFVFTFLRVFLKNNMFIKDLSDKASKEALKKDPKEKNPQEIIGYVKSLYFAYLFMSQKGLFSKYNYQYNAIPYAKNVLNEPIMHSDQKIALRQEKGEEVAKEKRKEKKATNVPVTNEPTTSPNVIKPIKKISGSQSSKVIKPIEKISAKKSGNHTIGNKKSKIK